MPKSKKLATKPVATESPDPKPVATESPDPKPVVKFILTDTDLMGRQKWDYSNDFDNAFFNRVLIEEKPPQSWMAERGIIKIADWTWLIWLTNGEEYFPAYREHLQIYEGQEPVGFRLPIPDSVVEEEALAQVI